MTSSGRRAPTFPTDDLAVPAPPSMPRRRRGTLLMPIVGIGAMLGTIAMMWTSGPNGARSPLTMILPVAAIASGIGMFMQSGAGRGLAELDVQRVQFIEHLGILGERLRGAAQLQAASLRWTHPEPSALWTLVGGPRMWERRATDADFLHARVGVGDQRLCRRLAVPPLAAADGLDPVSVAEFRRFARTYSTIADAPIALALMGVTAISVAGDQVGPRSLVRAIICQLAVHHSPDHLAIDVRADSDVIDHWDWIKWLPHNARRRSPVRRHSILVVDRGEIRMEIGAHESPKRVGCLRLHVAGQNLVLGPAAGNEIFARADCMSLAEAKACARRLSSSGRGQPVVGALEMWRSELNLDDRADIEPELLWETLGEHQRLCVPLGATANGTLLSLNISEASEDGIGPHGLCVGATGSGKSELLRTMVLGLIARHSPDELNLVLVDFKGGATFLDFSGMHHIAAIITNLSDEAYLVARMKDALTGELNRRQQQLRRAGNVADLSAYRALRRTDTALPPMPTLLIVVDEFAELLTQYPDFIEVFSSIGRLGRSLGVHMLLASQRLDESRLRGLESHLSYRICLKTLTAAESRSVLGITDAADLPATPGAAILRSADGTVTHFRAVRVTTPVSDAVADRGDYPVSRFTIDRGRTPSVDSNQSPAPTVMEKLLAGLKGCGSLAHQIWLPPLRSEPELDSLIRELPGSASMNLVAPVGVVDLPLEQRHAPLIVDVSGAGGNVAVVGAPQTGKSTAVKTLITSLSCLHDSSRIQFYCIDFGGGVLPSLAYVPHVGSVAARSDRELIRRTVVHLESLLRSREASTGHSGDLFLVIDGWHAFREEYGDLEPVVTRIAAQGLSVGVHVILTAARWADIRPGLKDQIGTRLELRLADPVDSEVDRRQAAMVPKRLAGRGIADGGDHFVLARPDCDLIRLDQGTAPPVPMLPEVIEIAGLPRSPDCAGDIYLGLGERELLPVTVDFATQPHLLILGDGDCGKTSVLRLLCMQLTQAGSPDERKLFVVDYRRTLLGVVPPTHLIAYAFSNVALAEQLSAVIEILEMRIPGADVTAEQLRDGSWWAGPQIFVIVDDYDLVSDVGDSLRPLMRLLPYAADIGLHLVIARRSAGASRAMFEPLLSQIRDTGCPALLMNGNPEEGSLVRGRRPASQPAGRGILIDGDDAQTVQVGWCPP
mgnify:FL=1